MIRNSLERRKVFLGRLASLSVIAFVVALSLLSAACNNVNLAGEGNGSGTVSLAIGDVLTKSVRSAGEPLRQTLAAETQYTVKARLSGGHTADTSITVDPRNLAEAALSFEGIPIGVTVRLDLEVWAGNSLVWIGSTVDDHTVVSGENPLSVEVGRVSGVLLWKLNVDSGNHNILTAPYGAYDSPAETKITFGASDSSQGTPFCFDGDGNLYVMPSDAQTALEVKKYDLQPDGTYYVDNSTNISTNSQAAFNHLAYDSVADVLYGIGENDPLKCFKTNSQGFDQVQGDTVNSVNSGSYLGLAAYDNVVYCATYTEEQEGDGPILGVVQLSSYKLEDASDGTKTATLLSDNKTFTLPEVFGSNPPTCQMIYQDGALYLLLSRVSIDTMYDTSVPTESYSLGAVLKINPDTLALDTSFGSQGYLGLADTSQTISGINATDAVTDGTVVYHGPTSSNDASVFYGPQGFVAIMPKKLVIADAGFSVSEDGNKIALTKKSRIITVDLETLAFETERVEDSYYQSEYPSSSTSGYEYIK